MNKKQTFMLGAVALGLSTSAGSISATESLDRLSQIDVSAGRVFCPYGNCDVHLPNGDIDVRLSISEEKKIQAHLAALNSLNLIVGASLVSSIAKPQANCYGFPCGDDIETKRQERSERARKLAALVEAAEKLQD